MDKNNPKVQTVVQGEASESDDDEGSEVYSSPAKRALPFPSRVMHSKLFSPAQRARKAGQAQAEAVVVAGEASESDEEEVDTSMRSTSSTDIPPLKVDLTKRLQHGSSADLADVPTLMSPRMAESRLNRPKYDTLLHRKLRESNWQFHAHLVEAAGQTYLGASRSLTGTTALLVKSHGVMQDVSNSMRLLTNDLFHLDDRIDIIQSCKLLPDICIPTPTVPAMASAQESPPQSA